MKLAYRTAVSREAPDPAALVDACASATERLALAAREAAELVHAGAASAAVMHGASDSRLRIIADLIETLAGRIDAVEAETADLARMLGHVRAMDASRSEPRGPGEPGQPATESAPSTGRRRRGFRRSASAGVRLLVTRMAEAGESRATMERRLRDVGVFDPASVVTDVIEETSLDAHGS